MAYPSTAPITEADVKARLGISGTTDDDLLFDLCAAAVRMLEEITGPIVERAALTVYADGGSHVAYLPEHERPGNLDDGSAAVAEWNGSGWDTLTVDDDYIAPTVRGSSTVLAGRLLRVSNRRAIEWQPGVQTVRVTAWTPGRFADTAAVSDSSEGATFREAYWMIVKHLWQSYFSFGPALEPEFETVRPVWPGFGIPNAARDLVAEHTPKQSKMAGFHG